MSTSETEILLSFVKLLFPKELLDYFEIVGYEETSESIQIYLDERPILRDTKPGHEYEKNGFLPESRITDFPIRDRKAILVVRRRRWKDLTANEIISNDYELVAKGTRHSKEFAAFLKGVLGQIPDSGFFA